jgi:polyhydroxyalkanoate synthesis repressor PhaR|tara:strand:- start:2207 stop:2806 length:600 start_codon:yes stop_codon:yes gene_type:complete
LTDEKASDTEPLVIKKYANRRLYNAAAGEFVTLADLHQLVKEEVPFVVQDAKSGKDLTASVLAQIIADEESKGHNMFSTDYLRQILKLYSDGIGPELNPFLEQSVAFFNANQEQAVEQFGQLFEGADAMEKFAEMGRQNFALFQKSMGAFAEAAKGSDLPDEEPPQAAAEPANQEESEIDVLRRELAEMQKRLETLSKK